MNLNNANSQLESCINVVVDNVKELSLVDYAFLCSAILENIPVMAEERRQNFVADVVCGALERHRFLSAGVIDTEREVSEDGDDFIKFADEADPRGVSKVRSVMKTVAFPPKYPGMGFWLRIEQNA